MDRIILTSITCTVFAVGSLMAGESDGLPDDVLRAAQGKRQNLADTSAKDADPPEASVLISGEDTPDAKLKRAAIRYHNLARNWTVSLQEWQNETDEIQDRIVRWLDAPSTVAAIAKAKNKSPKPDPAVTQSPRPKPATVERPHPELPAPDSHVIPASASVPIIETDEEPAISAEQLAEDFAPGQPEGEPVVDESEAAVLAKASESLAERLRVFAEKLRRKAVGRNITQVQ